EVKEEVVAAALVLGAELVKLHPWIVDTGSAGIGIRINCKRVLIERRSCRVWSGMRKGRVHTGYRCTSGAEKHFRRQPEAYKTSNVAGKSPAAKIASSPGYIKRVCRQVTVTTEESAGTLPEIGDDNDIGLVISRSGLKPCLPLAHIVGCSEVCVPVTPSDLQPT